MKTLKNAILVSLVMLVVCGLLYPLALTGISQALMPYQANGSMIEIDGKIVGSEHVGQQFTDERFFKGRFSAYNYNTYSKEDTVPDEEGNVAYGGVASGAQNLAPSNPALVERVEGQMDEFLKANPGVKKQDIPADLMTSSGSGLDPDISPDSAAIQIPAISKATGLSEEELRQIVTNHTDGKVLGVFGESTVNVLQCNIEIAQKLDLI